MRLIDRLWRDPVAQRVFAALCFFVMLWLVALTMLGQI
jgi:hypothetical protein